MCAQRPPLGLTDPAAASREPVRLVAGQAFGCRALAALVAACALSAGLVLASNHPAHPALAAAALAAWIAAAMRWRRLWLFVLPAALPAANFAPWTGWIVFDEFDLVLLGAATAGFAAMARSGPDPHPTPAAPERDGRQPWRLVAPMLCAATMLGALLHGLAAGGVEPTGWHDGYSDPLNALRVAKGPLYALLLLPLLRHELRRATGEVVRRVGAGMLAGIGVVVVAVVVERTGFPGLLDFSRPYRTTAWFWEMHVGGAAIDGYLAMAWPFVAWAVLRSRTPLRWALWAALALLLGYACLTTFSRGLYLGILGGICTLFFSLRRRSDRPVLPAWRRRADWMLVAALLMQAAAVLGTESFMRTRVNDVEGDFAKRLVHWQRGLRLLSGPLDWSFGKGTGRLPKEYAASVPEDELPGAARAVSDGAGTRLVLEGPPHDESLAGRYALTQRVPPAPTTYRATFDAHVDKPVRVAVSVCAMHLLHEGTCQRAVATLVPGAAYWQQVGLPLVGPRLPGKPRALPTAVFAVTVLEANARVELVRITLGDERVADALSNGDFSRGLAHWFPVASNYFVPWHIDNFFLELLIEQGVVGLAAVTLLLVVALARLLSPRQRDSPAAPYLAASLVGALLVGTVSSLLDMPRVAFLLFFLALLSTELGTARGHDGRL